MASMTIFVFALLFVFGQVLCQDGNDRFPDPRLDSRFNNDRFPDRRFPDTGRDPEVPIADGCDSKVMDIFFILDSSSSIYINDYRTELQFARDVVGQFDVRPDATRVGALTFSNDYERPVLGLNSFVSRRDAVAGMNIQNLRYRTGITNTHEAIRYVNELNDFRQDITKVIVVVTDGGSRDQGSTAREAERARENGFYVFVVGVGQYLDEREWRAIANDPDENFLYNITNFRLLENVAFSLPSRACSLPPIILRETCSVVQPSEVYFVASRTATQDAVPLMENFKTSTRDDDEVLSLNYMVEACEFATGVLVRDEEVCESFPSRRGLETADELQSLFARARNAARDTRENAGRPVSQTIVLFVDDATMGAVGNNWIQESSLAQQYDGIRVIVVNLGLRTYRRLLPRLASRENTITYQRGFSNSIRQTRNDVVERVCTSINTAPIDFNGTPL